jgi:hypothetical protein
MMRGADLHGLPKKRLPKKRPLHQSSMPWRTPLHQPISWRMPLHQSPISWGTYLPLHQSPISWGTYLEMESSHNHPKQDHPKQNHPNQDHPKQRAPARLHLMWKDAQQRAPARLHLLGGLFVLPTAVLQVLAWNSQPTARHPAILHGPHVG